MTTLALLAGLGGSISDFIMGGLGFPQGDVYVPESTIAYDIYKVPKEPEEPRMLYALAGETLIGIGCDFAKLLPTTETILSVQVSATTGLILGNPSNSGTTAMVAFHVPLETAESTQEISFTVTGSLNSVRKASRKVQIS